MSEKYEPGAGSAKPGGYQYPNGPQQYEGGPGQQYTPAGQQGWQPVQPGPAMPYGYATPPAPRSATLGVVGFTVVVVATVALVITAYVFGQGLAAYLLDVAASGTMLSEEQFLNDPMTQAYAESTVGTVGVALLACVAGLVGWIISIVATVQRRGRGFGIAGIVLGVLSLGLGYAALTIALFPALQQMGI